MLFKSAIKTLVVSVALLACVAQAKTFKYELQNFNSGRGGVVYSGLYLKDVKSVTLTVEQAEPRATPMLTSLEIEYIDAPKLLVKNLFSTDDPNGDSWTFNGKVNDAWVFRQVNVRVDNLDRLNEDGKFITIEVAVSEYESFVELGANEDAYEYEKRLSYVEGELKAANPSKVIDVEKLTLDDSRVKLSLRNKVVAMPGNTRGEKAFVIDVLWYGKGESIIYYPAYDVGNTLFVDPLNIDVTKFTESDGSEDYDIKITARGEYGDVVETGSISLSYLLSAAYDN
ncbi:hypothetical protein MO867_21345 [Microbulbifer sp. OS29]|uniref:Uncharacterized protein n=1 Tax=Microbulbifer okhotskensis TaxID=2926617 RepID=A0A9X2ER54_9GAMM|nr:hypothetical protein [Microbulbifer okhotskensis]MCO1336877.1 hypothetical protein [Microbulbifer okhotskensis]